MKKKAPYWLFTLFSFCVLFVLWMIGVAMFMNNNFWIKTVAILPLTGAVMMASVDTKKWVA